MKNFSRVIIVSLVRVVSGMVLKVFVVMLVNVVLMVMLLILFLWITVECWWWHVDQKLPEFKCCSWSWAHLSIVSVIKWWIERVKKWSKVTFFIQDVLSVQHKWPMKKYTQVTLLNGNRITSTLYFARFYHCGVHPSWEQSNGITNTNIVCKSWKVESSECFLTFIYM